MRARRPAYLASGLAIASAAVSLFWTLGGTWLLDTLGGSIEALARTRSLGALALGMATSLAKIGAALLALALVRPWGRHVPGTCSRTRTCSSARCSSCGAVPTCWSAASRLWGRSRPRDGLDQRALHWHVFVWDLWFLVWGVALTLALSGFRRENPDTVAQRRSVRGAGEPAGPPNDGHIRWGDAKPEMSVETHSDRTGGRAS